MLPSILSLPALSLPALSLSKGRRVEGQAKAACVTILRS